MLRAIEYQNRFSALNKFRLTSAGLDFAQNFIPKNKARIKHNLTGFSNSIKSPLNKGTINYLDLFSQKNSNQLIKKLLRDSISIPETYFDTLYNKLNNKDNSINNMLAVDYKTYMADNILTKIDRATMSASIEGREPLLDHRIIEFAARLPESYKFHNGNQKIILKDICHDYIPEKIMNRPKQGFTLPLYKWLREDLKDFSMEYLSSKRCEENGILSPPFVDYVKKEFFKGNRHYADMAWCIISFNNWAEHWL